MILINKDVLINYIKNLSINNISTYLDSYNISYNKEELEFIYHTIKYEYEEILSNPETILLFSKDKLNEELYNFILSNYNKYKFLIK